MSLGELDTIDIPQVDGWLTGPPGFGVSQELTTLIEELKKTKAQDSIFSTS